MSARVAGLADAYATLRRAGWYPVHDCGGCWHWRFDGPDGRLLVASDETLGAELDCGRIHVGLYPSEDAIATGDFGREVRFADLAGLALAASLGLMERLGAEP